MQGPLSLDPVEGEWLDSARGVDYDEAILVEPDEEILNSRPPRLAVTSVRD